MPPEQPLLHNLSTPSQQDSDQFNHFHSSVYDSFSLKKLYSSIATNDSPRLILSRSMRGC